MSSPQDLQPLVNVIVGTITAVGAATVVSLLFWAKWRKSNFATLEKIEVAPPEAESLKAQEKPSEAQASPTLAAPGRPVDKEAEPVLSVTEKTPGVTQQTIQESAPQETLSHTAEIQAFEKLESQEPVQEVASVEHVSEEFESVSPKEEDGSAIGQKPEALVQDVSEGLKVTEVQETPTSDAEAPTEVREISSWFRAPYRLAMALRRTREKLLARVRSAILSGKRLEAICEELEEVLIEADVGVETSLKLIEAVKGQLNGRVDPELVRAALKREMVKILEGIKRETPEVSTSPLVALLVGVNGVGKTTTLAKLAAYFKAQGKSVIVGAGDTFRAAAVDQLEIWCKRVGVSLVKHQQGSDPAAVAFDTVKAAMARGVDVALIDTAGRLQTKTNLMEELKKVVRVIGREVPGAPHEIWLVLDATMGQNGLSQARQFLQAVPLTGVILAKLDSSAKGGIAFAVAHQLGLPIRFVGVGEQLQDLREFDPREYVDGLLEEERQIEQQEAASASSA